MAEITNLLRGTLDLLVLRALRGGLRHGYAVAEWIKSTSDGTFLVEEGTLYPALHRLERKGFVEASWGLSSNKRQAKFYQLTDSGRQRLEAEAANWNRYCTAVNAALMAPT